MSNHSLPGASDFAGADAVIGRVSVPRTKGARVRAGVLSALLIAALVLTGCSNPSPIAEPIDGLIVRSKSIAEIANDATSLVVATVATSSPFDYLDVAHTGSVLSISKAVWGLDPGTEITLRQIGSAESPMTGLSAPVVAGSQYLLFITPFYFEEGKPTGEYAVVTQGSWVKSGDEYTLDVVAVDRNEIGNIPEATTSGALRRELVALGADEPGGYETNAAAESDGSNIDRTSAADDPNLVLVIGDHGNRGYVKSEDRSRRPSHRAH